MARPQSAAEFDKKKVVAENRRARFDFAIEQVFEAGIALQGTEVKSLRFGEGTIAESYAEVKGNEVWLINSNIPEFSHGNRHNHEPKRPRKLLLSGREINKMYAGVARQGMTLVPLSVYFNSRGRAKVGDGEWPVRGPDAAEGTKVRVVSAEGGVLVVEAA